MTFNSNSLFIGEYDDIKAAEEEEEEYYDDRYGNTGYGVSGLGIQN